MSDEANLNSPNEQYQVVALRYRPQAFGDLVGQGHVARALSNAIESNRVGHAYLFTGARGVGKTSSARIFAKCLNCEKGPVPTPCNECDICRSVSIGEDVDVLEIDGASNRGIDEIRQLRSNAAIRPGRGRYKIYIIDEVHMLTQQAFNALLKTLEEPPGHVKFIFCTTDPQKIPITVLSRCQRYDFSPVQPNEITNRLREIASNEGVEASDESLQLLARRANGSMRDSQSLLEQLFSFCGDNISVEEVHQLLGTTDMSRIAELAGAMTAHDAKTTLNLIHESISGGVDAGQLTGQLLGYFRDMITMHVGCGDEVLQSCSASDADALREVGGQLGLQTMLTVVQILDSAVVRMQSSLHARALLEVAAIRICNLEHLESIADLVNSLSKMPAGKAIVRASSGVKKKVIENHSTSSKQIASEANTKEEPTRTSAAPGPSAALASTAAAVSTAAVATSIANSVTNSSDTSEAASQSDATPTSSPEEPAEQPEVKTAPTAQAPTETSVRTTANGDLKSLYQSALQTMGDMTADMASNFDTLKERSTDHIEVALFDAMHRKMCSRADKKTKIEEALHEVAGRRIRVDFVLSANAPNPETMAPTLTRAQQIRQLNDHEFVKEANTIFDSTIADYHLPGS
jgi:DNA polymerase-3 subunit gamma/tau